MSVEKSQVPYYKVIKEKQSVIQDIEDPGVSPEEKEQQPFSQASGLKCQNLKLLNLNPIKFKHALKQTPLGS